MTVYAWMELVISQQMFKHVTKKAFAQNGLKGNGHHAVNFVVKVFKSAMLFAIEKKLMVASKC